MLGHPSLTSQPYFPAHEEISGEWKGRERKKDNKSIFLSLPPPTNFSVDANRGENTARLRPPMLSLYTCTYKVQGSFTSNSYTLMLGCRKELIQQL